MTSVPESVSPISTEQLKVPQPVPFSAMLVPLLLCICRRPYSLTDVSPEPAPAGAGSINVATSNTPRHTAALCLSRFTGMGFTDIGNSV